MIRKIVTPPYRNDRISRQSRNSLLPRPLAAERSVVSAGVLRRVQFMDLSLLLHQRFGFSEFRPAQKQVIDRVMAGDSVLAVMPTGSGKSLCYQLPALALPGLTLVVSPLIALMKDQVDQLGRLGLPATLINSTVSRDLQRIRLQRALAGH